MSQTTFIDTVLLAILAIVSIIWWLVRQHRKWLKRLAEKNEEMRLSQEGGRMQASREADEARHQSSRIMERVQFMLLRLDQWWRDHQGKK